ncbi:MAG: DUF1778 domain-containing protein [Planctomycetaceae bacterium]|nr:DUF1778 domain-containing protein [Planctomycetaceae bacterium]
MKKAAQRSSGRPRKKYGRRDFSLSVKLTAEEKELLERAADAAKMSPSDFIRSIMVEASRRQLGEEKSE